MNRPRVVTVGLLLMAAAGGASDVVPGHDPEKEPPGLVFRLSEGAEEGEEDAPIARPPAERLDDDATRAVLDRLPPWSQDPREEPFALREASLPPPRTGRDVRAPFPPPATAERPAAEAGESLELIRHAPEGEVPLAAHLSLTFSRPMVSLTSHEALGLEDPPVRLTPRPPGEWRWVGTRTLLFEPEGRFPMATEYRVEVPAGLAAAGGSTLEDGARWSFSTPPPRVLTRHPEGGPARRDALLFVSFDQDVDPEAVLATIRLGAGGTDREIRLATEEEVAADPDVSRLARQGTEGRWLVFRATERLPADHEIHVTVGPGTPSAEGPRLTRESQEWSFRTFGPLRVRDHGCGWRQETCTPRDAWRIRFTNPIDAKGFRRDMLRVDPEVPGLEVQARGDSITARGVPRGRTRYEVTLSKDLADVFGQTLGEEVTLPFDVGPMDEALFATAGELVVLAPNGPPRFPVYSVNHAALQVELRAVGPEDWDAWTRYRESRWRGESVSPPGRRIVRKSIPVEGGDDEVVETSIDLSPALEEGRGQVVVLVRPEAPKDPDPDDLVQAWVQATDIGLDAVADEETLLAWATRLEDGRPLPGVELSLGPGATARTDEGGIARLALPESPASLLVARQGGDVAFLPAFGAYGGGGGWQRGDPRDALRFFVFDDRRIYRPGEEVRVKGWLRLLGAGPRGDVEAPPDSVDSLAWTLHDSRGNETAKGTAGLGEHGSFDLALPLPATMNLGPARLTLEAGDEAPGRSGHTHTFEVQEFRRPEYEVTASVSEGPHVVGGHATAEVSASYYAGGALPGAEVSWRVSATPGHYQPPHWKGFVFGPFLPWWGPRPGPWERETVETFAARTDGTGVHRLRVDFEAGDPPRPRHLRAEATVRDVNRQAWTAGAELLVHPAELYVGLRSERAFVEEGEAFSFDVVVVDIDGGAVAERPVELRAERREWEQVEGEWTEVAREVREHELASGAEPVSLTLEGLAGGRWEVRARVRDERDRVNETEHPIWVSGGRLPPARRLEREELTLVPDREEYHPGDVARVLVVAPFAPAEGLMTLGRSGLLQEKRFTVDGGSHTLEIPVEPGWTPNVHVQVDLVGSASDESGVSRPAFAHGSLDLSVPPDARRLSLDVTPQHESLSPGEETVLDLELKDDEGRAIPGGEIAVVVVDEAVLALTGYRLPDPMDVFYSPRGAQLRTVQLRDSVLLPLPPELPPGPMIGEAATMALDEAPMAPRAMMAMAGPGGAPAPEPIRARTDFSALALFAPSVITDAHGRARVPVTLPDNLTRYRVMAVAAEGARRFGSGEATLVARLPLMVRPSPPRFLNYGDRFELPVVVQNQTAEALTVDVAVRARNAQLTEGAGRRVVVAANDRAEVRFPGAAARAGTAALQIGGVSGPLADAAELTLPVWTPATTEAFATYGQIDGGPVVQPVEAPAGVVPDFGGLEITTSSTALQALTDAVLYLVAYPFECAEQVSSRVLAVAALRDVLAAFEAEGLPEPAELKEAVDRDLRALAALQNPDGGFAFWRRGERSWPWVSVHAAHALARAKEKGFDVPEGTLKRSRSWLQRVDKSLPDDYPDSARRTVLAYALFVRDRLGEADPAAARAVVREAGVEGLTFEALGWLHPTLSADPGSKAEVSAVRRRLDNGVVETASAAHFAVSYTDGAHLLLHSDRRADAVVLDALIADQPESDLVPKLVAGLLGHRKAGRWASTQENVFALLALDHYFHTYEGTTPDFVARAWLGDRFAGEHAFQGRTTESHHVQVPMRALRESTGPADLLLARKGEGRMYYRLGLRYAPEDLHLDPLDRGFTVERAYEAVDDEGDVQREEDGTWRIRAGARVRVRLTMVAPARRHHVALVDPLPAGLEAVNPTLATTATLPGGGGEVAPWPVARGRGAGHWWWRPWFEHQNLRDERVEAFSSTVWAGVHTYRYVARATTPGTFVVPPPKAEEMYAPETFGRGGTDVVVVE